MPNETVTNPALRKHAEEERQREDAEVRRREAEARTQPSAEGLDRAKAQRQAEIVGPLARGVSEFWQRQKEGYQALKPTYTAIRDFAQESGLPPESYMDVLAQMGPPGATKEFIADPIKYMMGGMPRLWNWTQEK